MLSGIVKFSQVAVHSTIGEEWIVVHTYMIFL